MVARIGTGEEYAQNATPHRAAEPRYPPKRAGDRRDRACAGLRRGLGERLGHDEPADPLLARRKGPRLDTLDAPVYASGRHASSCGERVRCARTARRSVRADPQGRLVHPDLRRAAGGTRLGQAPWAGRLGDVPATRRLRDLTLGTRRRAASDAAARTRLSEFARAVPA